jgi:tRNA nucleotidyltransferase (CCA-adding enzyme)
MSGAPRWEHFMHEADIGVAGVGETREQAFEQAALALVAVTTRPEDVRPAQPVPVACAAPDEELLLADWLNALVYEMSTRRMLFGRFEVAIEHGGGDPGRGATEWSLRGTAWGEPVDTARHQPAVEVKGATLTQLAVRREAQGADAGRFRAQCVVDV